MLGSDTKSYGNRGKCDHRDTSSLFPGQYAYPFAVYTVLSVFRDVGVFRSDGELDTFTVSLCENIIVKDSTTFIHSRNTVTQAFSLHAYTW